MVSRQMTRKITNPGPDVQDRCKWPSRPRREKEVKKLSTGRSKPHRCGGIKRKLPRHMLFCRLHNATRRHSRLTDSRTHREEVSNTGIAGGNCARNFRKSFPTTKPKMPPTK